MMALAVERARGAAIHLAAGELWSFYPAAPATTLRCLAGGCWVTQAGDYRDHHLRAGDALTLQARGRVVVQALAAAVLEVRGARRAGQPRHVEHDRDAAVTTW